MHQSGQRLRKSQDTIKTKKSAEALVRATRNKNLNWRGRSNCHRDA
jgi:hypothetical protein